MSGSGKKAVNVPRGNDSTKPSATSVRPYTNSLPGLSVRERQDSDFIPKRQSSMKTNLPNPIATKSRVFFALNSKTSPHFQSRNSSLSSRLEPSSSSSRRRSSIVDGFDGVNTALKYYLLGGIFILGLVGVFMIVGGIWVESDEISLAFMGSSSAINKNLKILSAALLILGCLNFFSTAIGGIAVLRQNFSLMCTIAYILMFLVVSEITLSSLGFIYRDVFKQHLEEHLTKPHIILYRANVNKPNPLDYIQSQYFCCGSTNGGYLDWNFNTFFSCSEENPSPEKCSVPYSCCKHQQNIQPGLINTKCGYNVLNQTEEEAKKVIHVVGCMQKVDSSLEYRYLFISVTAIFAILLKFVLLYLVWRLKLEVLVVRKTFVFPIRDSVLDWRHRWDQMNNRGPSVSSRHALHSSESLPR